MNWSKSEIFMASDSILTEELSNLSLHLYEMDDDLVDIWSG